MLVLSKSLKKLCILANINKTYLELASNYERFSNGKLTGNHKIIKKKKKTALADCFKHK